MELLYIRITSLVIIALIYMLFDVFNKRNIPGLFIYLSLAYGFILTLLYLNITTILFSTATALLVLGGGYLLYRAGQLGVADVVEFAVLSMILPTQITPLLSKVPQFNLPLIISLLINTGISAFIVAVLYYLPKAKMMSKTPLLSQITNSNILKALTIGASYTAFLILLVSFFGFYLPGVILILLLLSTSILVVLFEKPLTSTMVSYVSYTGFEAGDIIALNLMSQSEIGAVRKKVKRFDRLLTDKLIKDIKTKGIRTKFPVYKNAMPLALPIFIGVCLSLLFGDLLLFIIPFATSIL
jgi:Flp pilus assembly protein protease CpaA